MLPVGFELPLREIQFSYARSSGPGGQNVNKVNSKAVLRWDVTKTLCAPPELKTLWIARLGPRLSADGCLVLASDRFRDQGRNREDCLRKLLDLLRRASRRELPRKETRVPRGEKLRRRESKTAHSRKKALRRSPRGE